MEKYTLEKTIPKERYYKVSICADSNDADYITEISKYNQKEFDEIVNELINIKYNYGDRHEFKNYPNILGLYLPYCEWGCHTLEYIEIQMYDIDGSVYNVILHKDNINE